MGGWLVGLPFTSGPVSLFLSIEQGTRFAADAAAGSIAGSAAASLFAVVYAAVARRAGWPATLAAASLAFIAGALALRLVPLGSGLPLPLLALYVGTVASALIAIAVIGDRHGALEEAPEPPPWDLPARMIVATAVVVIITAAAPILGPQTSGLITTYPVYASVLAVFAHAQRGGAAGAQVVRGLCFGLLAFATFFLAIGALIDATGIVVAFIAAIAAALLVQSATLTRLRTVVS